jgi:hypothetical protein
LEASEVACRWRIRKPPRRIESRREGPRFTKSEFAPDSDRQVIVLAHADLTGELVLAGVVERRRGGEKTYPARLASVRSSRFCLDVLKTQASLYSRIPSHQN